MADDPGRDPEKRSDEAADGGVAQRAEPGAEALTDMKSGPLRGRQRTDFLQDQGDRDPIAERHRTLQGRGLDVQNLVAARPCSRPAR
jgi:hypothetical protein